jgi:ribose/xylose/arabinose/galactoside ABC-type transport system permease subunit
MTTTIATAPDVAEGGPPTPRRPRVAFLGSRTAQSLMTFVAFMAVFVVLLAWLGTSFADVGSRLLDVHQNAPILLLSLAVLVTLVSGQFDLSVGSMATLTTFLVVGLVARQGWPMWLAIVVCLLIGAGGGLLNALLVMKLRVTAFIATLGTGGVLAGISSVYSGGSQLAPTGDDHLLPTWFSGLGSLGSFNAKVPDAATWSVFVFGAIALGAGVVGALRRGERGRAVGLGVLALTVLLLAVTGVLSDVTAQLSWTIAVVLAISTFMWLLLHHTAFGRRLFATGSNATAARLAGVNPVAETTRAFVIGGLLAASAGVLLGANQGSASPDAGAAFLLPAFAGAFLSTVLFSTGGFNVWGAIVGGTFLIWVAQGLIIGGLPFTWTSVINGSVLVLAVALSTLLRQPSKA